MLCATIRANRTQGAKRQGMVGKRSASERLGRLADRLAVLAARRVRAAGGLVSQPEPRSIGVFARGKQLTNGNVLLAGHLAEVPDASLWDQTPDPAFVAAAQGFAWLDDLAAFGTPAARNRAQDWTWDWIARYGAGRGPGWTPDLTGRRIIRWIHHATFLLTSRDRKQSEAFYRALSQQAGYLSRRWKGAAPGLPRFEALAGLVYAGLSLIGMERLTAPAIKALAAACETDIDPEGGIPSRNPEELLEVLTLLTWSASAMTRPTNRCPRPCRGRSSGSPRRCARCATPMALWRGSMAATPGPRGASIRRWRRPGRVPPRRPPSRWALPGLPVAAPR